MKKNNLNIFQVAISLVSLHYGLGFLFGTSESVYQNGLIGVTYALMCAVGLFLLSKIVPFYHRNKNPIWVLFQEKYNNKVKNLTMFLSWFWMIGVAASQIVSAAYLINLIKIPIYISIITVIIFVSLISILPLEKLAKTLLFFLIINSSIMLFSIFYLTNLKEVFSHLEFNSLKQSFNFISFLGIAIPTVLITVLGMDFHQFVIKGKNISTSIKASILAGVILLVLTFIPTSMALGIKYNYPLPDGVNTKQIIPYSMVILGEKFFGPQLKYFFLPFIAITAIGSCSCLVRMMTQTFQDFKFIPNILRKNKRTILFINGLIIFFLAINNETLISLIVSFYIIYTVGVFTPFLIILLGAKNNIFKTSTIYSSMLSGVLVSLIILIMSKVNLIEVRQPFNLEFVMVSSGIITSLITLFSDKIAQITLITFFKNKKYEQGISLK